MSTMWCCRMSVPKAGGITVNKFPFLRGHIFEVHFYALCGDISLLILPWCLWFFPLQTVQDHLFHVCTLLWCDVTPLLSFPHHVWRCFFLVVYFLLYIGCRTYIFFILTTSYGFDSFLKHWIRSTRHCNNQCHVLEDFFILYVVQ